MTGFRKIAVAGKGQLGSLVVKELLDAGFAVTVLTRSNQSSKKASDGTTSKAVDYESISSLVEALKGQDVLIATLAMHAIFVQHNLLEAAIQAGVRRFVPSEYSGITLDPFSSQLPFLAPVMEIQNLVKSAAAEGKIEYTIFAPGGFLNLMLNEALILHWNNHTAYLYDGGVSKISVSRLSTIAKGIAAALKDEAKYKNKIVKYHDTFVTQQQVLDIAKRVQTDQKWKEVHLDARQIIDDSLKKLAAGTAGQEVVGPMLLANSFRREAKISWEDDELDNKDLGIPLMSNTEIEAIIEARARGKLVEGSEETKAGWKVEIK